TGLSAANTQNYDLLLLDLTLPNLDGLEVCRRISKQKHIPIIISSARSDVEDKIKALDYGADDYLPKPYDPKELLA
ncbi:DNA-binding response regulator, partial [Helicobacter pylori]